jgi:hypothetical protein
MECRIAGKRRLLDSGFKCPTLKGQAEWTKAHVERELALKFAPILYHHPLERYFLVDPSTWATSARLFDRSGVAHASSALVQDQHESFLTCLNGTSQTQSMHGGSFDSVGRSKAKIW